MSKKQIIRRRGLCGLLALAMCIGVMPPTAGAAVTAENDWEIFDASDTYNLPGTQEQILQEMISTGGYQMYKKEQVDHLIDLYFEGNCDDRTRIKIYCYIAVCGLLWSNWCEYKRKLGVEFGEYSLRQYRYAKDYYKIVQQELGEEGKETCTK